MLRRQEYRRLYGREDLAFFISRRAVLAGISAGALMVSNSKLYAETALPTVTVSKDPNCGCCGAWVDHLRAAGFTASVRDTGDLPAIKRRLGVPGELASCHTAEVGGYVIEGHVPADAVKRLLAEKPAAIGLSVPGCRSARPAWRGEHPKPTRLCCSASKTGVSSPDIMERRLYSRHSAMSSQSYCSRMAIGTIRAGTLCKLACFTRA